MRTHLNDEGKEILRFWSSSLLSSSKFNQVYFSFVSYCLFDYNSRRRRQPKKKNKIKKKKVKWRISFFGKQESPLHTQTHIIIKRNWYPVSEYDYYIEREREMEREKARRKIRLNKNKDRNGNKKEMEKIW